MKIVLLNNVVYAYATGDASARGGAERFQWLLARALARAGWSVVVGVRERIAPGQERIIEGVRFVGLKKGSLLTAWWKFLSTEKPDWWFWRAADPLWPVLLMAAKLKGVRSIFSAAFDTDVSPRRALFRRKKFWPLYAWGLKRVDRIFVQHSGQYRHLAKDLRSKAAILPGLVALPARLTPASERGNYVVWVAVLRPHKRPDLLMELARATPDLQYMVCGGTTTFGTSAEFTARTLKDLRSLPNIRYLGDVEHERTLQLIAGASVLVSTSDLEGYPNIFLEAWSSGTPVVSLMIDPDDVIKENDLGFVAGGVAQAAADLRRLLASQDKYAELSRRVRLYAEQEHSEAPVVRAFHAAVLGDDPAEATAELRHIS